MKNVIGFIFGFFVVVILVYGSYTIGYKNGYYQGLYDFSKATLNGKDALKKGVENLYKGKDFNGNHI